MANVPSGISSPPSGIGNIGPGGYSLPGILKVPAGYNFPAGIIPPPNVGYAPGSASLARPKRQSNHSGQVDVTGALLQSLGAGSAFNPMAVFDLMNLSLEPFGSSGRAGYQPATPNAGMPFAGPAVIGGLAPIPHSGGKGVIG
jgi:hypothetical protein